jgi:hypothetical protein
MNYRNTNPALAPELRAKLPRKLKKAIQRDPLQLRRVRTKKLGVGTWIKAGDMFYFLNDSLG